LTRRRQPRAATPAGTPPAAVGSAAGIDRGAMALGALVVVATLVLYFLTAARDIVVGDTPELTAVAISLGVAHAPGYPLFTLIGHAFSWLPIGPLPFRVNLLSSVCGALTVGVVFLTTRRLTSERLAAAAGAALLAVDPLFWKWSLATETFPLNGVLIAGMVYLLVRWQERPERTSFLAAAGFCAGLALSNHLTIVLLGPAIVYLLARQWRRLLSRPRIVAICAGAVVLGLLPYAYIPWAAGRHPFLNAGGASSFSSFVALVTRADYGSGRLVGEATLAGGAFGDRLAALLASFPFLEGSLILLGAWYAYRRRRWYFWFTVLAFAVSGPAFVAYANLDLAQPYGLFVLERFFLLPHVVVAPLAGLGCVVAADWAAATAFRGRHRPAVVTASLLVLAFGGVEIVGHYQAIDQSDNHVARYYAEDILATLEPRSILLVSGDDVAFPVSYLQAVEAARPDVTAVWLPALRGPEWYRQQLLARDPDLVIPFVKYEPGAPASSLRAFVDANSARPIALIGSPTDDSLRGSYWGYPRGLVFQLEPTTGAMYLDALVGEYETLMSRYRIPSPEAIKSGTFESGILRAYAIPSEIVGTEYERAGRYAEARACYERALAIDPSFSEARESLAHLAAGPSGS
jgi:4-amino-4-deoxy-L-arabinose transferase-like glycosyltransferase